MKILFVTPFDCNVRRSGGTTYSRGILDLLTRPPLCASVAHLRPRRDLGRIRGTRRRLLQGYSVLASLVSPLPAKAVFLYTHEFNADLRRKLAQERYDAILVNGSDQLWMLPHLPSDVPVVLVSHNIEHRLYEAQISSMDKVVWPIRRILARDLRKLERYETEGLARVPNVISISTADAEDIRKLNPAANIICIPPVFSYEPYHRPVAKAERTTMDIGFMARFDWWPNREGATWFIDRVMPYVSRNIRLHLFGEGSDSFARRSTGIIGHGYVEKISDVFSACDFMICPMFSGAGVNVKFAEAIYNGVPILATSFAARGLDLPVCSEIVLRDSAEEWIEFLASPGPARLRAGRVPEAVSRSFDPQAYAERMRTFMLRAMHGTDGDLSDDPVAPVTPGGSVNGA